MMNVFSNPETADKYDAYYQTDLGKKVDIIEKGIISELIKDIPRNSMLELGCGTGHWTEFFIEKGFDLTGIDVSEAMLKIAKQKGIKADLIEANAQELPFRNNSFEVVASITMLEFVSDQDRVLHEIYRVLKPGGWLILGCLNANSILGERKEQDEVFKYAHFLTAENIRRKLKIIGKPELKCGVYLSAEYELLDTINNPEVVEPVFIGVVVQKIKS